MRIPKDIREERSSAPSYPRLIWSDIIGATRWKGYANADVNEREGERKRERERGGGERERERQRMPKMEKKTQRRKGSEKG